MVDLDRARRRVSQRGMGDIPVLFQAVELRPALVGGGWLGVALLVAGAIALALRFVGGLGELAGGLLAAFGVVLAFVLIRCRRFEVTVGTNRVETRVGFAERTLPLGLVTGAVAAPASSWRRAYTDREVRLEVAGERVAVPTREPEELLEALGFAGRAGELKADR